MTLTSDEIAQIVTAVCALLAAASSLINRSRIDKLHDNVHGLHLEVNSRLSELIAANKISSVAEGRALERAETAAATGKMVAAMGAASAENGSKDHK